MLELGLSSVRTPAIRPRIRERRGTSGGERLYRDRHMDKNYTQGLEGFSCIEPRRDWDVPRRRTAPSDTRPIDSKSSVLGSGTGTCSP